MRHRKIIQNLFKFCRHCGSSVNFIDLYFILRYQSASTNALHYTVHLNHVTNFQQVIQPVLVVFWVCEDVLIGLYTINYYSYKNSVILINGGLSTKRGSSSGSCSCLWKFYIDIFSMCQFLVVLFPVHHFVILYLIYHCCSCKLIFMIIRIVASIWYDFAQCCTYINYSQVDLW